MCNKEKLIERILEIEWDMFSAVQSRDGRAPCQDDPATFKIIRRSQFMVWSDDTLESYLNDLEEAKKAGRNLMTLKYARMEDLIPPLDSEALPLIDKIVEIMLRWTVGVSERFPYIQHGRPVYTWQEPIFGVTSSETYARGELETYSERTLELYYEDILDKVSKGLNGVEVSYDYMVRSFGYKSLTEANERLGKVA